MLPSSFLVFWSEFYTLIWRDTENNITIVVDSDVDGFVAAEDITNQSQM